MVLDYDTRYLTRNGLECFLVAEDENRNDISVKKCTMVAGDFIFRVNKFGNHALSIDSDFDIVGKQDAL